MATSRPIFNDTDRRNLELNHFISSAGIDEMVNISRCRFTSSCIGSISFCQYDEPDKTIQVPTDLHSPSALVFLGLDEDTAEEIHRAWVYHNPEDFADYCAFAKDWLEARNEDIDDIGEDEGDWARKLRESGLHEARLTITAFEWVKESMDMRWEFLQYGERASKVRGKNFRRLVGGNDRGQ